MDWSQPLPLEISHVPAGKELAPRSRSQVDFESRRVRGRMGLLRPTSEEFLDAKAKKGQEFGDHRGSAMTSS